MVRLLVGVCIVSGCFAFVGLEYMQYLSTSFRPESIVPFAVLGVPTGFGCWLIDTYQEPKSALEVRMERVLAPYRAR